MKRHLIYLCVFALTVILLSANKKPVTLFLVGDSTMADKTELDISPERGWGQLFPTYLKRDGSIIVENHAKNGRSTKSFIDQGRWDNVVKRIKRGDIVIIQFGHNDAKQSDPQRYTSIEDYRSNLMQMVKDVKKKGGKPILATSCCRRYFKPDGTFRSGHHGAYPTAVRQVAEFMNVPLIDAEELTKNWLTNAGKDESKKFYMHVAAGESQKFPNGKIDNTHFREAGALAVGRLIAKEIKDKDIKPLSQYIDFEDTTPLYTTRVQGIDD